MLAGDLLDRIEEQFLVAYAKAGKPREMALFTRHESLGDLHCELIAYLSPASVVLAAAVGADPCVRPEKDGLSLMVGCEEAWRVLFPERR